MMGFRNQVKSSPDHLVAASYTQDLAPQTALHDFGNTPSIH